MNWTDTVANAALALALIQPLGHVGIALATGVTAWLNVGLLARSLHRRGQLDMDDQLLRRAPRIALACLGMGAVLWLGGLAVAPYLAGAAELKSNANTLSPYGRCHFRTRWTPFCVYLMLDTFCVG